MDVLVAKVVNNGEGRPFLPVTVLSIQILRVGFCLDLRTDVLVAKVVNKDGGGPILRVDVLSIQILPNAKLAENEIERKTTTWTIQLYLLYYIYLL